MKIEGHDGYAWKAKVTNEPEPVHADRIRFKITFTLHSSQVRERHLVLWLSDAELHHDKDKKYQSTVFDLINQWLGGESIDGELSYFG